MVSSAGRSSREKMAVMRDQVEADRRSPWASVDGLLPWQEGTAVEPDGGES
jgi:hypothetical protein